MQGTEHARPCKFTRTGFYFQWFFFPIKLKKRFLTVICSTIDTWRYQWGRPNDIT